MLDNLKILPIGSVVIVNGSTEPVMIVSAFPVTTSDGQEGYFDFGAVPLPLGLVSQEMFFFNKEDISSVLFVGYIDTGYQMLHQKYDELVASIIHEKLMIGGEKNAGNYSKKI